MERADVSGARHVVCIHESRRQTKTYTVPIGNPGNRKITPTPGYVLSWDTRVIAWPAGDVVLGASFEGGEAPSSATEGVGTYGLAPRLPLVAWLGSGQNDPTMLVTGEWTREGLRFTPDGERLAVAVASGVWMWDIGADGNLLRVRHRHHGVRDLAERGDRGRQPEAERHALG